MERRLGLRRALVCFVEEAKTDTEGSDCGQVVVSGLVANRVLSGGHLTKCLWIMISSFPLCLQHILVLDSPPSAEVGIGDIRANLEDLKRQTDALPEPPTSKICSLLQ